MANVAPHTGQTIRITASSLTDAAGVALTAPTVVFTVTDPNGTVTTPSVTQSGATYYIEFTSSVVGKHMVRFTAVAGTGTAKDEAQVQVYDFTT